MKSGRRKDGIAKYSRSIATPEALARRRLRARDAGAPSHSTICAPLGSARKPRRSRSRPRGEWGTIMHRAPLGTRTCRESDSQGGTPVQYCERTEPRDRTDDVVSMQNANCLVHTMVVKMRFPVRLGVRVTEAQCGPS